MPEQININYNPNNNFTENFDIDDSLVLNKLLKLKYGRTPDDDGFPTIQKGHMTLNSSHAGYSVIHALVLSVCTPHFSA